MTNWEKYKDEILKYSTCGGFAVVDGKLKLCELTYCADCDMSDNNGFGICEETKLKWLDEEYKEPSPYEGWEIDDKIEVSSDGLAWNKRHFAGISEKGKPLAWVAGRTSWSSECDDDKAEWGYARKVEE